MAFGRARVVYPEAGEDRCRAALVVEVGPVGLRNKGSGPSRDASLAQSSLASWRWIPRPPRGVRGPKLRRQVVPTPRGEAPADAAADPVVDLLAVACPTQSSCEAIGSYHYNDLLMEGLEVHQVRGTWVATAVALPASAGAPPGSPCHGPSECPTSPASTLASVSCPAAEACAAVGRVQYPDSSRALVWTESAGAWATAFEPAMPAGGSLVPEDSLVSVACPSAGNCTAVDAYGDQMVLNGLAVDEAGGTWQAGVEALRPQGPNPVRCRPPHPSRRAAQRGPNRRPTP